MTDHLLKHIENFVQISDEKKHLLPNFLKPLVFGKKEFIIRENEKCRAKYFIVSGCVHLAFIKNSGVLQTVDFALENWWITDYSAFSAGLPAAFSVQCIEKCVVLELTKENQDLLLKEIPGLDHYFHRVLERAVSASQFRLKIRHDLTKEEQYLRFRKNFPEFVQRVPQYLIASFLGITPEYLSEIRRNLIS